MKKKKFIRYASLLILTCLFILLLLSINNGYIAKFDNLVYKYIFMLYGSLSTKIFKAITFFGSTLFVVLLVILLFIVWKKNRGGLRLGIVLIVSTIANNLIKVIIRRPRPQVLRLVEENTYSFPSGHTMAVTTLVGFIIYYIWAYKKDLDKKYKILFTVLLLIYDILVMISRIYLGAHFASDVIGGVISSSIVLIITIHIMNKYLKK